jgi:4,5-DOPA dioxygenase extradiol
VFSGLAGVAGFSAAVIRVDALSALVALICLVALIRLVAWTLRSENVLIIGSGSFTHNLTRLRQDAADAPHAPDVVAFSDWFDAAIREQRQDDLLTYRTLAPFAAQQHPTEEHLLPLYGALGAGGESPTAERLHGSAMYSSLRMDAYAFR